MTRKLYGVAVNSREYSVVLSDEEADQLRHLYDRLVGIYIQEPLDFNEISQILSRAKEQDDY